MSTVPPLHRVELECRPDAVLRDRAVLEGDPAAGAEEPSEELAERVCPADAELPTGRFTEAAVWLEGRGDAVRVTGRERRLVLADDV